MKHTDLLFMIGNDAYWPGPSFRDLWSTDVIRVKSFQNNCTGNSVDSILFGEFARYRSNHRAKPIRTGEHCAASFDFDKNSTDGGVGSGRCATFLPDSTESPYLRLTA